MDKRFTTRWTLLWYISICERIVVLIHVLFITRTFKKQTSYAKKKAENRRKLYSEK